MIPGMAYLVRRLLENTSNESFLRQNFVDGMDREALLKNPLERSREGFHEPESLAEPGNHSGISAFQNEPQWNWTVSEYRTRFADALEKTRKQFPYKVSVFIEDKKVETGAEIHSTNPNDPDEIVGIVASSGSREVDRAVAVARAAFPAWKETDQQAVIRFIWE